MAPEDIARRRAAKRFNERLKLFATFLNNTGIAAIAGGLVLPLATGGAPSTAQIATILTTGLAVHILAQLCLTIFRSED